MNLFLEGNSNFFDFSRLTIKNINSFIKDVYHLNKHFKPYFIMSFRHYMRMYVRLKCFITLRTFDAASMR